MPKLADVAEINPRLDRSGSNDLSEAISFVPMANVSEILGAITSEEERELGDVIKGFTTFRDRDVLVAKITPCFENGKIAHARIDKRLGFGSTEFHVVRPLAELLDDRYLYHFLRQPLVRENGKLRMTGSGGQKRVPKAFLEELNIPLPPLAEQRRLAAILDKADALRAKRREAIAKLDLLLKSVFLEMFGDTTVATTSVAELAPAAGAIRTGPFGSQLLHSEFVDHGIAVLGIDNAVSNTFAWAKPRFITEEKYSQLSRYRVNPGDVLITIMGTCGRCAVVPDDIPTAINTKHLCCISIDRTRCEPEFLHSYFLLHPVARNYLESRAKGAIMAGLNMGIIKELPVALPSIEKQRNFVSIKKSLGRQLEQALTQENRFNELFAGLQQHAFAGTL
ncbi:MULTISPECIES: restriction endonuclease subunit S [Pseudomonas]|uniref:restriction endonuclease subunit S n=1 Tax=Pseudomonas TaxID=286 RepID=UPI00235F83B2|nr:MULTISPECIES: restriction endonuclease subunit S [Pseudomonas]WJV27027.1 restriction endonuclease subunit S [Pseudomonas chlororaphis]